MNEQTDSFDRLSIDSNEKSDNLHHYFGGVAEDQLGDGYAGTHQVTQSFSNKNQQSIERRRYSLVAQQRDANKAFSKLNSNEGEDITGEKEEDLEAEIADGVSPSLNGAPTQRRGTLIGEIIPEKYHYWSKEFKAYRINIAVAFAKNYLVMSFFFVMVLSIFYGSIYNKQKYFKNLRFLVVNDDFEVDGITPFIGNSIIETIESDVAKTLGTWVVMNHTEINQSANDHNNTIIEEINRMVHHQKYWAAVYVHANSTLDYINKIRQNSTLSNVLTTFSSTGNQTSIDMIYETGRDFLAVSQYVHTILVDFESIYLQVVPTVISQSLTSVFSASQLVEFLSTNPSNLLSVPFIKYIDNIPVGNAIMLAPLEIGLLYLVVFSFFQFITTIQLHMYVATRISGWKYVLYRMIIAQVAYLFVSLAYVVLNAAFQISFTVAFGRSGFLVAWAIAFLLMSSLGTINEIAALILFTFWPPMVGFYILLLMVLNLSPTLSPIILLPKFYRYGYALPVHNAYNAMSVVYFDAWKGKIALNIGVMLIWIVLTNLALPFVMKWTKSVQEKKAAEAAANKT